MFAIRRRIEFLILQGFLWRGPVAMVFLNLSTGRMAWVVGLNANYVLILLLIRDQLPRIAVI